MCKARCIFAMLLLSVPIQARSQTIEFVSRRLQLLDSMRRVATATLMHAESLRLERLDTVRAGVLVVATRSRDVALVREAAGPASARLDSLYGDATAALARAPLLFNRAGQPTSEVLPQRAQRVFTPENATADEVAFDLVRAGTAALRATLDSALTAWLGPLLLADVPAAQERARVYVELATAPSVAVRHCYAGALDACAAALGLVAGDQTTVWYDAAERRALVRQSEGARTVRMNLRTNACLNAGSDDACLEVLHQAGGVEPPLSSEARQTLVRTALTTGRRGAFARLAGSAGKPMPERLALAAAMPADSLLRRWRAEIMAGRPHPVPIAAAAGWAALGWCVAFGLLALRSTRWR